MKNARPEGEANQKTGQATSFDPLNPEANVLDVMAQKTRELPTQEQTSVTIQHPQDSTARPTGVSMGNTTQVEPITPEQRKLMELRNAAREKILNPEPGSALARARDYGMDLTLIASSVAMTPDERLESAARSQIMDRTLREIRENIKRI